MKVILQIPFQVLAFTDKYKEYDRETSDRKRDRRRNLEPNTINNSVETCSLLEFFSDKMSNQEFNTMAKRLFNTIKFTMQSNNYGLGGTPLNAALSFMTEYVGKFIRTRNVEKMSFITLTDGVGAILTSTGSSLRNYNYGSNTKSKHFLTDPITKKTYLFTDDSQQQTGVLLQIIQDRFNTNNLGF